ncbi:hypothetical protein V2J09_017394 [Rumex salicifolius]
MSRAGSQVLSGSLSRRPSNNNEAGDTSTMIIIVERPGKSQHQRRATMDSGDGRMPVNRLVSMPRGKQGEQVAAGWPPWLVSVAGEAIHGWMPRRADSFQKLDKIGQGTYSSVYKARDLETGRIVAMKKVRFLNMEPESVRFMAREIIILRRLDHPNVMKLEGLVSSRMSDSLYLIFEYMEHDLVGLLGTPGNWFTESQIKCYIQQLLQGLEHCHNRGVLHRDIKGANLLINNDGVLKIGDFGLATFFRPERAEPLTSRVVTLWYRAPELLLGSTDYGIAVDMWSAGCILAELFAGKPIMPGRTEVEQMHKIFKLCGSPSDSYWKKLKLPHATSFKPTQPYKRGIAETFSDFPSSALALVDVLLAIEPEKRGNASSALSSEFFTTYPLPCDPSSLPKYPPAKEQDVKLREEEKIRMKVEEVKGQVPESTRRAARERKPGFDGAGGKTSMKITTTNYNGVGNGRVALTTDTHKHYSEDRLSHCSTMIHPSAAGSSWMRKPKEDDNHQNGLVYSSSRNRAAELRVQSRKDDSTAAYVPKKNRMHYSGPLMPPGGNIDDMLKEHERQIQQAVRKSRARNVNNSGQSQGNNYHGRNVW